MSMLTAFLNDNLKKKRKNASSGMLHHVVLVRTDVSEECIASIIRGRGRMPCASVASYC
jgi:phosphoribosyl-AMP cyclohydrolase